MKILMVSSESLPFVKVGGLADVVFSLSKVYAQRQDIEVCVFLPFFRQVREFCQEHSVPLVEKPFRLWEKAVFISSRLFETVYEGVSFFFVDIPHFFDRESPYGTSMGDYIDNYARFSSFCQVVFSCLNDFQTDIVHLHDWPSSLLAYYLKCYRSFLYKDVYSVLTIHNIAYQGLFPFWSLDSSLVLQEDFHIDCCEFYGQVNWLKMGISCADKITTVSQRYSQEVMFDKGCELEGVLRSRRDDFQGICNGLDKSIFSPQVDSSIIFYGVDCIEKKQDNKKRLLETLDQGLCTESTLFVGMVTRVVSQKGLELVIEAMSCLFQYDIFLIIVGVGDKVLEDQLQDACQQFSRLYYFCCYDPVKASQVYAGSDIFLMPSHFEPCGLGQLIAMSYGTLPLVTPTGGLLDTVEPIKKRESGQLLGSGFIMQDHTQESLLTCIDEAVDLYYNCRSDWDRCVRYAMTLDFSWEERVEQYIDLYQGVLNKEG